MFFLLSSGQRWGTGTIETESFLMCWSVALTLIPPLVLPGGGGGHLVNTKTLLGVTVLS